jgi:hypothetical protein
MKPLITQDRPFVCQLSDPWIDVVMTTHVWSWQWQGVHVTLLLYLSSALCFERSWRVESTFILSETWIPPVGVYTVPVTMRYQTIRTLFHAVPYSLQRSMKMELQKVPASSSPFRPQNALCSVLCCHLMYYVVWKSNSRLKGQLLVLSAAIILALMNTIMLLKLLCKNMYKVVLIQKWQCTFLIWKIAVQFYFY